MIDSRILVITGAGISAESGIPTFRGKDGYWRNRNPAELATPEAFERDPEVVWEWYRERRARIRAAQPNSAHQAISKLAMSCREFLLVTQNVDDLHTRGNSEQGKISPQQIIKIHGDIFVTRCSVCDSQLPNGADEIGVPRCVSCAGAMRPGVVWFGEQLDPGNIAAVEKFLAAGTCDYVLVVGTTAVFGYIVDWALHAAGNKGRIMEVNPAETALSSFASELVREPAARALPRIVESLIGWET